MADSRERNDLCRCGHPWHFLVKCPKCECQEAHVAINSGPEQAHGPTSEFFPAAQPFDLEQAVIEILANCAGKFVHPEGYAYTPQEVINQQIKNGAAILAKYTKSGTEDRLVDVKERLPEQVVSFSYNNENWTSSVQVLAWASVGYDKWGWFVGTYSEQRGWECAPLVGKADVTHWRELPAPPKSGTEGE